jgi:phosphatidyl-myo-inositol dimannoside synthase
MRVLMLVTDAYGGHGGIAFYNRCLAEALAEMPEVSEIVVVPRVMRFAPSVIPPKIRFVHAAAGSKYRYVAAVMRLAAQDFDLVICGHINLLPVAVPYSKLKRRPLALAAFGIDVWTAPSAWVRALVRQADAIWAISAVTRDRMNEWVGWPQSKYALVPPAIRLEQFGMAPPRPELVARFGLADRKVVMTLARLAGFERYKGIDEILETLPALLEEDPSLTYMILGDGDDRVRLERKAQALGIASQVVFTGFIEEADKADYLRLARVFALPGKGEGFGIVYLEALACGVPVVGSRLDGSRDALLDGELGELADPNDPQSVRECILRALAKPVGVPKRLEQFDWPAFRARVSASARAMLPT